MSDIMNIGIVGCGGMGGGHAIAIASGTGNAVWNADDPEGTALKGEHNTDISKKMALAGVYDIDPARQAWAAERGYYNYESYEAMLADDKVGCGSYRNPQPSSQRYGNSRQCAPASMFYVKSR